MTPSRIGWRLATALVVAIIAAFITIAIGGCGISDNVIERERTRDGVHQVRTDRYGWKDAPESCDVGDVYPGC